MELRILAVGDVVGLPGLSYLSRHLRSLKQLYKIDFWRRQRRKRQRQWGFFRARLT